MTHNHRVVTTDHPDCPPAAELDDGLTTFLTVTRLKRTHCVIRKDGTTDSATDVYTEEGVPGVLLVEMRYGKSRRSFFASDAEAYAVLVAMGKVPLDQIPDNT